MIYLIIYLVGCFFILTGAIYFAFYREGKDVKVSDLPNILLITLFSWLSVCVSIYVLIEESGKDFTIIKFKKED